MKERLEQLIVQAGLKQTNYFFVEKEFEVLAQLIAGECIDAVRDVLREEGSPLTYEAASLVQNRIREIFEVPQ